MEIDSEMARDLTRMEDLGRTLHSAATPLDEHICEYSELRNRLIPSLLPLVTRIARAGLLSISLHRDCGNASEVLVPDVRYAEFECDSIHVNGRIAIRAGTHIAVKHTGKNLADVLDGEEATSEVDDGFWDSAAHFDDLEKLLEDRPLLTVYGEPRLASVYEFMFMGLGPDGEAQFKHNGTRNYVYVLNRTELIVPQRDEAFHHGFFDEL